MLTFFVYIASIILKNREMKQLPINQDMWFAYLAVQESGVYNMFDPRSRELANEMNDLSITRSEWIFMMSNYSELKNIYKK